MPGQLQPLNDAIGYLYCPTCRTNGTDKVMMKRELHLLKCPFGHQFEWAQVSRMNPDMTPMSAILTEQPNPLAVQWKLYIMPKVKQALEEKYPGRLMTTLGSLFDALAEDQIIFIQGSEATELKKRGIKNGREVVAALDSYKEMERERDEAIKQFQKFRDIVEAMSGGEQS